MLEVINNFCEIFGQSINFSKSKLFVSKNVDKRKSRKLSRISGIAFTDDLGKYLGIPLLHKRISKQHFVELVEKVQKKLSCWKSNTLMLSGRSTLVQTSSATIPSYTMQTMLIPTNMCNQIDKLNRNFFWGDTQGKKKIHLVN